MNDLQIKGTQKFSGKKIPVVLGGFGKDQKCMSDKTIAEIHRMQVKNIRSRITDNIKRFKENIDFIDLKKGAYEASTLDLLLQMGYAKQSITQAEHIYILSERGYAKLIKIMDTDLAWEIHDKLIDEYFQYREVVKTGQVLESPTDKDQIKLMNARSRMANTYLRLANVDTLSNEYKNILVSKASEVLAGKDIIPLPKLERNTMSAEELGKELGITACMVGRIANKNDLKQDGVYGEYRRDKSRYSAKEVDTFVYYPCAVEKFKEFI